MHKEQIPEPVNISEDYVLALRDFYNAIGKPFDSFDSDILLEDGLERSVGKVLERTGTLTLPGNGRQVDLEEIRRSKAVLLQETAAGISAIKDMIPLGHYGRLCEQFDGAYSHSLMGEPDEIIMNAAIGRYDEQSQNLEKNNQEISERLHSRAQLAERDKLKNNLNCLKGQLANWAVSNYSSYFFLKNITDRSRAKIEEGMQSAGEDSEPDYGKIMEGVLDFAEALYLPFESRDCSYPAKDGYWRNLIGLYKKGVDEEQLGEFASAVRSRIEKGFPIADAVALEMPNFEPRQDGGEQ